MGPGAKIIIGNGGMLTIDNCHLYVCGNGMWEGIKIYDPATNSASNGWLFIQNNSLIEDARCAVSVPYGSNVPIVWWSPWLRIQNTVFNKNDTAISIRNYYPTISPAPIYIASTIFTCRKIPYSQNPPFVVPAAYYNAVRGSSSYPGSALTSPYINNTTYPVTTTKLGQNAKIGIYLNDVGTTSGTSLPLSYNEIQIGFMGSTGLTNPIPFLNVFDNMSIAGIYALDANLTCFNNVFQNGALNTSTGNYGQGIYAEATATQIGKNLKLTVKSPCLFNCGSSYWSAGNNMFFDLSRAIYVKNYLEVEINNCDIRSTQTTSGSRHKGEYGILDQTFQFYKHYIVSNTLFNIENGIIVWTDYGDINIPSVTSGSVSNSQYSGHLKVDSNIVQANYFSQPLTTQFVSNAIHVENTSASGTSYSTPYILSVKGNTLKDVYRGIEVANYFKKRVYVYRNCITLRTESGNPLQYGIVKKQLTGITFLSNFCTENDIRGPGFTNPNMYGIRIDNSRNEQVRCNKVDKVYNSIAFDGGSGISRFIGNSMFNYIYGYSLKNNSVIGPQGGPGSPSDNQWGATNCLTQFKTLTFNANPVLSPLYVRSNPPVFNPNGCGAGPPPILMPMVL